LKIDEIFRENSKITLENKKAHSLDDHNNCWNNPLLFLGKGFYNKKMKKILILVVYSTLIFLSFPLISLAAEEKRGLVPCGTPDNPCQLCHLFVLFNNIVNFLFTEILPPLAVLLVAYGGLLFIFGGENPQNIEKAKSILKSVGWGLLIILSAWLIVNLFFTVIGVAEWTGLQQGWFKINCPLEKR
jgi:hypothetical protein